ncbi:hypothetical protein ACFOLF_32465 [Paenibacillus sepulcri]|uniref:hypothetical protein n=1 Tax=Paenibacillus sepulcri TaxID=359917 RepID=UPI001AE945F5
MFELHDALADIMSICILCSFAYLYLFWVPAAAGMNWTKVGEAAYPLPRLAQPSGIVQARRQRLTRQTKRKEAPDDDSSPCTTLLNTCIHDQQGGWLWKPWNWIRKQLPFTIIAAKSGAMRLQAA